MNRPPILHPLGLRLALGRLLLSISCIICAGCATARPAVTDTDVPRQGPHQGMAASVVAESARTLNELRAASAQRMLDYALEDARAVIVLPGVYQAGFFYSLHVGNGVLVARRDDGGWGAPVLVSVGGAGYGPQIGLEKSRLVLVVREDEMLARILASGLNFDATAKFDIIGVREETGPGSLTQGRPVLAVSDGVGLMAGVALRGGVLSVNQGLTEEYHGRNAGSIAQIMKGTSAPGLEVFQLWSALVVDLPKAQIIRSSRP